MQRHQPRARQKIAIRQDYNQIRDASVCEHETRQPFTELAQAERYVKARLFITKENREGIIWAISPPDAETVIGDIGYAPSTATMPKLALSCGRKIGAGANDRSAARRGRIPIH